MCIHIMGHVYYLDVTVLLRLSLLKNSSRSSSSSSSLVAGFVGRLLFVADEVGLLLLLLERPVKICKVKRVNSKQTMHFVVYTCGRGSISADGR